MKTLHFYRFQQPGAKRWENMDYHARENTSPSPPELNSMMAKS
ncbi:hypothetical protein PIN31115_02100 [Pandoraea iniqua]|uniref:Uncharacterized protein n=1 Tax=Pandoraea iniqua TaxID=2508288 RepID=A0A5E4UM00_9BURK|nr:hypothetical protein PIN31115_02100 [Pandoraea iniqua]